VDADVELHPSALATALAFAERQDSPMVSWFGTATTVTFWERVLQPMILDFITTHSDPRRVNDLTRPDAIANGQFILIRAALYRELGGHEAVRASIVEDMALARRAKAAGHRLRIAEAYGLMTTRMYSSFGTIWAGWAKNFYAGLHGRADAVIAALVYLALTGVLPHAALAVAGVLALLGVVHPWLVAVSAVAVAGQLAYRLAIARRATPPSLLSAVAHPLAASILALIVADSARRAVTGVPVSWKGRQYDTGGTSAAMPDDGGVDRDDGTGD
jgi:hypothetical protein